MISRRALIALGAVSLLSACSSQMAGPAGRTTAAQLSRTAILGAINGTRRQHQRAALSYDTTLEKVARTHANLMASRNAMSHTLGGSLRDRVNAAGYFGPVGENLGRGYGTLEEVVQGWLDSPGHRSTLLNDKFSEFGLAAAVATDGRTYWAFVAGGDLAAWM